MSSEGAENKRHNVMECKQVCNQTETFSPIGQEASHDQGDQGKLPRLLLISAWRRMKMRAKLMANALESACGGNIFHAGDGKALEEQVTDNFIRDSSDEEEFSTVRTLKVRLNRQFVVRDRLRTVKQAMTVSDNEVENNLQLDITGSG